MANTSTERARMNSPASTVACHHAVRTYLDLLTRHHRGEIDHGTAVTEFTKYVTVIGGTEEGANNDVAGVLSALYSCLTLAQARSPHGHTPMSSSHQLKHLVAAEEEASGALSNAPSPVVGGRLHRLRPGLSPSSNFAAGSPMPHGVPAGSPNPHAPAAHDGTPSPRRTSFLGSQLPPSHSNETFPGPHASQNQGDRAPEEEALSGGLGVEECRGFALE